MYAAAGECGTAVKFVGLNTFRNNSARYVGGAVFVSVYPTGGAVRWSQSCFRRNGTQMYANNSVATHGWGPSSTTTILGEFESSLSDSHEPFCMLNRHCKLTLPRPTAAPTATSSAHFLTLQFLFAAELHVVPGPSSTNYHDLG